MPLWGITNDEESKPKYLSSEQKEDAILIDEAGADDPANKPLGLDRQGWHLNQTYTSHDGATRRKVEVLVAMAQAEVTEEGAS